MNQIEKNYGAPVNWNVGACCCHDDFMIRFLTKCREYSVQTPIRHVFGSIPCEMQGGRMLGTIQDNIFIPSPEKDLSYALDKFKQYNNLGVGVRVTFSRTSADASVLADPVSNSILSYLNTKSIATPGVKNGVIVADDTIAAYVRKNYPNLELLASIVGTSYRCVLGKTDTIEYYKDLLSKYDIVVLNPGRNTDDEFLSNLPEHDRFEIMANHMCTKNCPVARRHYIAQEQVMAASLSKDESLIQSSIKELKDVKKLCRLHHKQYPLDSAAITTDQVKHLVSLGFKNFKLEGRDDSTSFVMHDMGTYLFDQFLFAKFVQNTMDCYVLM